jgi:large repetitive protein
VVNGYVNAANDTADQTLGGTAEAGSTVNVYLNGATLPAYTNSADGSGNWSVTLGDLADGSYSYTATATDAAGNTSVAGGPLAFTVDTQAPSAPTIADASVVNGYVNAANDTPRQTLGGLAEAGSTVNVYLNGATSPAFTTSADGSGNWSVTLGDLADGSYSYTATATDAAGNVSAAGGPLAFTVDTRPRRRRRSPTRRWSTAT